MPNLHTQAKTVKISALDKLNALARSKLYASDYEKYTLDGGKSADVIIRETALDGQKSANYTIALSKSGKTLCEKWDLFFPYNPEATPIEDYLFCCGMPIQFVPDPSSWTSAQAHDFIGCDKDSQFSTSGRVYTHINDRLSLLIDLTYPKEKLREEFERYLNRWAKSQKKGSHEDMVDKWEVFDIKKNTNGTLTNIAREIHKIEKLPDKKTPSNHDGFNATYQIVQRAFKAATDIVKALEDQAQTRR